MPNVTAERYMEKSIQVYKMCAYRKPTMIAEMCLCFVGMLNTFIFILVFTRPHMRKSSMNLLIAALETANFISMVTRVPSSTIRAVCPEIFPDTPGSVFIEVANTLYKPSIIFANWMMPVIGLWRFVAVTWPIKAHLFLTKRLARWIMLVVAVASAGFSIYIFVFRFGERSSYTSFDSEQDTCYILPMFPKGQRNCVKKETAERKVYLTVSVIMSVVPCVISVILNGCLIGGLISKAVAQKHLKEGQNKPKSIAKEARITMVLVLFLTAHVICYVCPDLFTLIVYLCPQLSLEQTEYFCFLFYHFPAFIYLSFLALICYCIMSGRFRRTLVDMLSVKTCLTKTGLKQTLSRTRTITEVQL